MTDDRCCWQRRTSTSEMPPNEGKKASIWDDTVSSDYVLTKLFRATLQDVDNPISGKVGRHERSRRLKQQRPLPTLSSCRHASRGGAAVACDWRSNALHARLRALVQCKSATYCSNCFCAGGCFGSSPVATIGKSHDVIKNFGPLVYVNMQIGGIVTFRPKSMTVITHIMREGMTTNSSFGLFILLSTLRIASVWRPVVSIYCQRRILKFIFVLLNI